MMQLRTTLARCLLLSGVAAGFLGGEGAARPRASAIPDFAPNSNVGWIGYGLEYIPVPGEPHPVAADPAHPFIYNSLDYLAARPDFKVPGPATFAVADVDNPILQPWVREELRKTNAQVLAGKMIDKKQATCWPIGVPGFLLYPVQPVYFLQSPKEVAMIWQSDMLVRHVYLNVPHRNPAKPSWFGDSIGHYEGDTLVVDTIGLNTRTFVDNFRTPHTAQLHVVERFRIIEGGKTLEVKIHVEDPGAFTGPWNASQRYARVEQDPLIESICAENHTNYFNQDIEPIPEAKMRDF
jgi:hypothetical protein